MTAAHGFTLVTMLALVAGLVGHGMKQYIGARRVQSTITLRAYYVDHWPETVLSIVSAAVLWGGLPEFAGLFPDLATALGLGGDPGVLSSFTCGFVGNSLADFLGGRAKRLAGGEE